MGVAPIATRLEATMDFGVLGPLKIWWPSPAGPLTAPKLRGLLTLLLVEDDPVPAGQLMELFRGRREAGAPTAMHVSVHKLRRWLHGGHRLELTAQGYTVDVDPALVDAGQFRLRLAAADAAADQQVTQPPKESVISFNVA